MPHPIKVAIDFDGTIVDTNRQKAEWILRETGMIVAPWQCSRSECEPLIGNGLYERMSHYVYRRECTLATSEVHGALALIQWLATNSEIYVITARSEVQTEYAIEWFKRNGCFGALTAIRSSHPDTKANVCRMVGATLLIDDDIRHLLDVPRLGIGGILLHEGRSSAGGLKDGVVTCRSWDEVRGFLGGIVKGA